MGGLAAVTDREGEGQDSDDDDGPMDALDNALIPLPKANNSKGHS